MKKYAQSIGYSVGARPQAITKYNAPSETLSVRDFFLHLMFARLAASDGTTYEFDTKFSKQSQELELKISQKFIDAIGEIEIGPKMRQFLDWLIDRNGILAETLHTYPYVEVDTDYTIEIGDFVILADATDGPINISLPPTSDGAHCLFKVKRMNGGSNQVRVISQDSGLIDGLSGWSIDEQYAFFTVFGTGSQWVIV